VRSCKVGARLTVHGVEAGGREERHVSRVDDKLGEEPPANNRSIGDAARLRRFAAARPKGGSGRQLHADYRAQIDPHDAAGDANSRDDAWCSNRLRIRRENGRKRGQGQEGSGGSRTCFCEMLPLRASSRKSEQPRHFGKSRRNRQLSRTYSRKSTLARFRVD
jgi:hypothetical protein